MSQFYLTLPSNSSMDYYPDNTVANFKTRLANPISLDGDWDVALYEIQYKKMWYTINYLDTQIMYHYKLLPIAAFIPDGPSKPRELAILNISQGYYNTIDEIVKNLNTVFDQFKTNSGRDNAPTFGYNNRTTKIFINLYHGDRIIFKSKLAAILGITDNPRNPLYCEGEKEKWHADEIFDLDGPMHSLYIYYDILEHIPVGDVVAPLLRVIGVTGKQGDTVRKTYDKPMYVPVRMKNFDSIEIDIRTDTGESVPFQYGKSEVILHFRLRKNPYFL